MHFRCLTGRWCKNFVSINRKDSDSVSFSHLRMRRPSQAVEQHSAMMIMIVIEPPAKKVPAAALVQLSSWFPTTLRCRVVQNARCAQTELNVPYTYSVLQFKPIQYTVYTLYTKQCIHHPDFYRMIQSNPFTEAHTHTHTDTHWRSQLYSTRGLGRGVRWRETKHGHRPNQWCILVRTICKVMIVHSEHCF